MALFDTPRMGASVAGDTGYQIQRSLRFDNGSSAYLSRTAGSPTNQSKGTFSAWVKRTKIDHSTLLFGGGGGSQTNTNAEQLAYMSGNTIASNYKGGLGGCSVGWYMYGTRKLRDLSAWMHILVSFDWTQSGDSNRLKYYINGVQDTLNSCGSTGNGFQYVNVNGQTQYMGRQDGGSGPFYSHHYMAETYFIDGTVYTPSDFTETDSTTGVLVPLDSSTVLSAITLGNNGGYYNFSDTSDLGKDHSSNSNDFTAHNFSVATWPDTDSVEDTPTNNFCTLNPLDKNSNVVLANGNLQTATSATSGHYPVFSTMSMKGGKWYVEAKLLTNDGFLGSIMNIQHDGGSLNIDSTVGNNTSTVNKAGYGLLTGDGRKSHNGTLTSYGSAISGSDVWMCAFDADNGKIWWGKNGTWFASGNPAAGSNAAYTGIDTSITWNFAWHHYGNNNNVSVNFGQQGFTHTPPTGFKALCSANLPDPTILLPNKHIDTLLWNGDSANSRDITGLNFKPDLVWIKSRNYSSYGGGLNYNHVVWDALRGPGSASTPSSNAVGRKELTINENYSEGSTNNYTNYYGHVSAFNNDGFTLGKVSGEPALFTNLNGRTYVGWNWNAGGSTASNSDGSITSSVRANASAGFSIISYTGTGSSNVTVGHGLGVKPDLIIIKARSSTGHWDVHAFGTIRFSLNLTEANQNNNQIQFSSSTFTIPDTNTNRNGNGVTYIAYCFSSVEGYSKFGTYTGNGSTNGTFVYTGFRPAFVISKRTDSTSSWQIWDNKRDIDNPTTHRLRSDLTNVEDTGSVDIDLLSNGFKLRNTGINQSNGTYMYLAFAESPFKNSRAR